MKDPVPPGAPMMMMMMMMMMIQLALRTVAYRVIIRPDLLPLHSKILLRIALQEAREHRTVPLRTLSTIALPPSVLRISLCFLSPNFTYPMLPTYRTKVH